LQLSHIKYILWFSGHFKMRVSKDHSTKLWTQLASSFRREDFKWLFVKFYFCSLVAILDGRWGCLTYFWKKTPKNQSGQEKNLVQIGSVILNKMVTIRKANDGQMTGCPVVAKAHLTLWVRWAIQNTYIYIIADNLKFSTQ
jgi:hypothetical protein